MKRAVKNVAKRAGSGCAMSVVLLCLSLQVAVFAQVSAQESGQLSDQLSDQLSREEHSEADDIFNAKESLFDQVEGNAEAGFEQQLAESEARWDALAAQEEEKWQRLEKAVLQYWSNYQQPSAKVWIDYSSDRKSMNSIDFEKGEVEVAILLPKNTTQKAKALAVDGALAEVLNTQDTAGNKLLEGAFEEEATPDAEATASKSSSSSLERGDDGVERLKITTKLSMTANQIERRAIKYLPEIEKSAKHFVLEPALILAVIHSESAFNPMARSHIPAFGLMQLVPRFAAKEAYIHLFGEEKLLSADYLYQPGNNILLGATYLSLLEKRYFKGVNDADMRRMIVICAYNWGPTAMRERLLPTLDIDKLDSKQLYDALIAAVPNETKHYLERVEKRRKKYQGLMDNAAEHTL